MRDSERRGGDATRRSGVSLAVPEEERGERFSTVSWPLGGKKALVATCPISYGESVRFRRYPPRGRPSPRYKKKEERGDSLRYHEERGKRCSTPLPLFLRAGRADMRKKEERKRCSEVIMPENGEGEKGEKLLPLLLISLKKKGVRRQRASSCRVAPGQAESRRGEGKETANVRTEIVSRPV